MQPEPSLLDYAAIDPLLDPATIERLKAAERLMRNVVDPALPHQLGLLIDRVEAFGDIFVRTDRDIQRELSPGTGGFCDQVTGSHEGRDYTIIPIILKSGNPEPDTFAILVHELVHALHFRLGLLIRIPEEDPAFPAIEAIRARIETRKTGLGFYAFVQSRLEEFRRTGDHQALNRIKSNLLTEVIAYQLGWQIASYLNLGQEARNAVVMSNAYQKALDALNAVLAGMSPTEK